MNLLQQKQHCCYRSTTRVQATRLSHPPVVPAPLAGESSGSDIGTARFLNALNGILIEPKGAMQQLLHTPPGARDDS
jgi:hypothetical protein